MNLETKIEAVLFWKGEPISVKKLAGILKVSEKEAENGLLGLQNSLSGRGITIIRTNDEVEMRTAGEASSLIENLTKEELTRDLGKAGLETIAIILYKGEARRSDIDYVRGVNSSFIIRNLLIRGLIERTTDGKRGFLYKPSVEILSHLGISRLSDLPDFGKVKEELEKFEKAETAAQETMTQENSAPEAAE
ncbi:MAG TPA: SMC-Scp complex subunit ScpB [Candidatus Paceibacterota bacterium]|nr:SMC-Scp complex subunit ScpB [Candidatus Paceibacterota bacterium]